MIWGFAHFVVDRKGFEADVIDDQRPGPCTSPSKIIANFMAQLPVLPGKGQPLFSFAEMLIQNVCRGHAAGNYPSCVFRCTNPSLLVVIAALRASVANGDGRVPTLPTYR